MSTLLQYFSISNIIHSIIAGIITSIIIWIFYSIRSLKFKSHNMFFLLFNLNNYLLTLHASKKIEEETILPLIAKVKEFMDNYKENYDADQVVNNLVFTYRVLEAKFKTIQNKIICAMNVSNSINMSYINERIRLEFFNIYNSNLTIKKFNIEGVSINIVEKKKLYENDISINDKELNDQIANLQTKLYESPDNAQELSKKIFDLKEQKNIFAKERYDDIILESEEVLKNINIILNRRTEEINNLIETIKHIKMLFPHRYRKIIKILKKRLLTYIDELDEPLTKTIKDKLLNDMEAYFET